ncbi:integrase core domain-containing protein [Nitrobacter sp. JJSN]|uniref:integrase core domain-containing protein n=1 Tax=Nitrobacter sp. JJSN TaxID=3453033 RepID=UPI003F76A7FF
MDRKSDHASVRLEAAPRYLMRDRDGAYGEVFIRRVRSMGIRDRPTSPRSPWQNAYAERLIGSIRRECLDHVAVFGERHLCHVLSRLQADHDLPLAYFPKLAYEVLNGITLCEGCHRKSDTYARGGARIHGGIYSNDFRANYRPRQKQYAK